ncbi:hypothetical protein DL98DRAFT_67842 [Cadophora sp. DSE1049]|nr:hypothetical protein DL98DRAFT_67842 [Cadophora sp. DSE1049]
MEDACVDVQHKKRGRPRLRDKGEQRYEGLGTGYGHLPPDASMRRPLSMYPASDPSLTPAFEDIRKSGSYGWLKSHRGPIAAKYPEHASSADANMVSGSIIPTPRILPQEPICAYLTMEMQIVKTNQAVIDTIGFRPLVSRKLQEVVGINDREKVMRLQRALEEERHKREPNFLPPIFLKFEEERVILSVGFDPDDVGQLQLNLNLQEILTFHGPDGQQHAFQARFGVTKKQSTFFIALILHLPATPQTFHQPARSPYSRESYPREPQYVYQPPQQLFPQTNQGSSLFIPSPVFAGARRKSMAFRTPGPLRPHMPSSTNMLPFVQLHTRPDIPPNQNPYQQTPRSAMSQAQPQSQHPLQLAPIRDPRGEVSSLDFARQRNDRTSRVDIRGLLEKPHTPGGT